VLCHLYEDQLEACGVMDTLLTDVARRFRDVKCLRIKATSAVENFPSRNLPALFIYHDGTLQHQLITLASLHGLRSRPEDLEWYLFERKVLDTQMEEPPKPPSESIRMAHSGAAARLRLHAEEDERGEEDILDEYDPGAREA